MKTVKQIIKAGLGSSLAFAVAIWVSLPVETKATDLPKGGQKLIELNRINTVQDAQALKPGDMIVMTCPKCKDTWVTYVDTEAKGGAALTTAGTPTKSAARHLCPGCQTTIVRKGQGKGGQDEIVHVCKKCGSKDAFCCVLKKGSDASKGMEKDNK